MEDKKAGLSEARKGKTFQKNPIKGTKFTIAISSAKGELENLHLRQIWP